MEKLAIIGTGIAGMDCAQIALAPDHYRGRRCRVGFAHKVRPRFAVSPCRAPQATNE